LDKPSPAQRGEGARKKAEDALLKKSLQPGSAKQKGVFSTLRRTLVAATAIAGITLAIPTTTHAADSKAPAANVAAETAPAVGTAKRLRLLTTRQYLNTIQYFFGPDITTDVKFAPLARTEGVLMVGASLAGVSDAQLETYQKIAGLMSSQVVDPLRRDTLFPCKPADASKADNACAAKFLGRVVENLYFVPPPKDHVAKLVAEAGTAANRLNDFYAGMQVVLESVLLSPSVLMVAEAEEADPKRPGQMRLDAYSQAARLSLFLWNAAPGPELIAAARKGDLFNEKSRKRIVDDMLASARLEAGVRAFFDDMFGLEDLETLSKDATVYPYFLGGLPGEAREQTLRTVVDQLLTKDGDYRDLFTTRQTFISPPLGILYGVQTSAGWNAYEFPPESDRAGILTHASFLARASHATRSSATLRGKALRELLLCQKVPPPPANVDFSAVENPDPRLRTARERVGQHLANPVCAGCHKITDPIGLSLEKFDGAGRYRDTEKGAAIDTSGNFDGKNFETVEGLGQILHDSPAVPACLVRRAFSYATASVVPPSSNALLAELNKGFAKDEFKIRPLLRSIVMHPAFSTVSMPNPLAPEKSAAVSQPAQVASNR
jgi:hypothetical protein